MDVFHCISTCLYMRIECIYIYLYCFFNFCLRHGHVDPFWSRFHTGFQVRTRVNSRVDRSGNRMQQAHPQHFRSFEMAM